MFITTWYWISCLVSSAMCILVLCHAKFTWRHPLIHLAAGDLLTCLVWDIELAPVSFWDPRLAPVAWHTLIVPHIARWRWDGSSPSICNSSGLTMAFASSRMRSTSGLRSVVIALPP